MKFLKKLLDTTTKKIVAIVLLLLFVTWIILFFVARDTAIGLIKPLLWTLLIVAVAWLAIHFGVKAWRKRKRKEFDEAVAAKEGIDDRRKEWSVWTAELEKQGIDRYELPFYLLVGEPQSGKSVLLHNSDLHFPFGQDRLSGVGGTRGCDWWFTDEAVVLDLAGRLFTHEGGAADRLEFEAFLQLLYEFRPLCPANGVILVIPCDSLLADDEEECAAKATKIQNALLTLTTKLQAQLPVYLVMTKGDHVFGFAEAVHRLDVEHRHQMFGWSREADKIDSPFDLVEVTQGFERLIGRSRLLRAHMMAGARIPEALPEVDRLYAFPHELEGMQQNLEIYLKRIFTASNITDRVFFRGLYLTSGLQSGVPIAKVCTDLFGQPGEADSRDLEALFSKQRAYFIKDLVRNRIFGERGLVRPTQGRVQQTQRSSIVGYGIAGVLVVLSIIFAIVYLAKGKEDQELDTYQVALEQTQAAVRAKRLPIPDLLYRLQLIGDAIDFERGAYEKAYSSSRDDFKELYCALFDGMLVPTVKTAVFDDLEFRLQQGLQSHEELKQVCDVVIATIDGLGLDFSDSGTVAAVLAILPPHESLIRSAEGKSPLNLEHAFELRDEYGPDEGLLSALTSAETSRLVGITRSTLNELEGCLTPGAPTQPKEELGYMLAWSGASRAQENLVDPNIDTSGKALEYAHSFATTMAKLAEIEPTLSTSGSGKSIELKDVAVPLYWLGKTYRPPLQAFLTAQGVTSFSKSWPPLDNVLMFANKQFEGHEGAFNLSSLGLHFGSEDFGQTMFQQSETVVGSLQGKFIVGKGADYNPQKDLDEPLRLLQLCQRSLPRDFRGSGLTGLGAEISEIDVKTLGSTAGKQVVDVFLAELVELADLFEEQLPDYRAARNALTDESPEAAARPLSVKLVQELVKLHLALGSLIQTRDLPIDPRQDLVDWQSHVEGLLEKHLSSCGPASRWAPDVPPDGSFSPEAWALLESLNEAAKLVPIQPQRNPVADVAATVQREAVLEMGQQLVDRWRTRKDDDLRQTVKTAEELSELARGIQTRLGTPKTLSGVDFEAWSGQVDNLLHSRLSGLVEQLEAVWQPNVSDATLLSLVTGALSELKSVQKKIDESKARGMDELGPILKALEEGGAVTTWLKMPDTNALLTELRQWQIPTRVQSVEGHEEYTRLLAALERLSTATLSDGPFLAAEYEGRFLGAAHDTPAANAGIRLVRQLEKRVAAKLRSEIRRSYLGELEELLTSTSNTEFFDALFWKPGDDTSRLRDTNVRDSLDKLFKQRGDFEELHKRYAMAEGQALRGVLFPEEPERDEGDWAAVHRFLVDLRKFLLAGDDKGKSVRVSTFDFWFDPATGESGSVWSLDTLPPDEKRDWFWFPADDSSDELQREPILADMGRLRVSKWGFDVSRQDRAMQLLWSRQPVQSQARVDPEAYRYEVPSCLAPMLLAWTGEPVDDELLEYDVTFTPRGSKRPAPMRVIFDRPLPVRPPRP